MKKRQYYNPYYIIGIVLLFFLCLGGSRGCVGCSNKEKKSQIKTTTPAPQVIQSNIATPADSIIAKIIQRGIKAIQNSNIPDYQSCVNELIALKKKESSFKRQSPIILAMQQLCVEKLLKELDSITKAIKERQSGQDVRNASVRCTLNTLKQEFQDVKILGKYTDTQQNIAVADIKIQKIEKQMEDTGYGVIAGIPNIGNTCYMNSALQILAALYTDNIQSCSNNIGNELKQIIETINKGYENVTNDTMNQFLRVLDNNVSGGIGGDSFLGKKQQDPHEFFYILHENGILPTIQMSETSFTLFSKKLKRKDCPYDEGAIIPISLSESRNLEELVNNHLIGTRGQEISGQEIKGSEWKDEDENEDEIFEFIKNNINTSTNLGDKTEGNTCVCTMYKLYRDIRILPILLKRYNNSGKINDPIQNPCAFTLKKQYTVENISLRFALSAFIVHIGNELTCGHYVAYIKKNEKWYEVNDDRITLIGENYAKEKAKEAYMFFYRKQ